MKNRRFEKETKEKDMGSLVDKLMKSLGLQDKMKEIEVIEAWPELMGNGVAHRTEKLYIRNKILHIKLNSSVMRDELQYGRTIIIDRVNKFAGFGIIHDVWFE